MNRLDQIIGYISPTWQFKRQFNRNKSRLLKEILPAMKTSTSLAKPSYDGASRSKRGLKSWLPLSLSPNREQSGELQTLTARSRDLYRNDNLARSAINTSVTNIVGAGLQMKCSIDAELLGMSDEEANQWERIVEREFGLWSKKDHCDAARKLDFGWMQELALLSVLQSGDVFATMPFIERKGSPYKLRIQLIEADRVCNRAFAPDTDELSGGIRSDRDGAPLEYHILKKHPNGFNPIWDWAIVPAFGVRSGRRNVIHLFKQERPGQNRGVPFLAPIIESINLLKQYSQAELMAAVVNSLFTVFIKTEAGEQLNTFVEDTTADEGEINLGPGAIAELAAGESIELANPNRPNQSFDGFVLAVSRQIGAALEIPFELLVKNFTSSYSASRAALLEAWKFFKTRRKWLADNFCQPVYEEFLAELVLNERISAPGFFDDLLLRQAYSRCQWIGPAQGQIDPTKETEAAIKKIENDLSTRAAETAAIGGDWEANIRQRIKEESLRREGNLVESPSQG